MINSYRVRFLGQKKNGFLPFFFLRRRAGLALSPLIGTDLNQGDRKGRDQGKKDSPPPLLFPLFGEGVLLRDLRADTEVGGGDFTMERESSLGRQHTISPPISISNL